MAVPKRKVSSARQNKRRSNVWKLQAPALMRCPQCGEYKTPHRVCGCEEGSVICKGEKGTRAMRSLLSFYRLFLLEPAGKGGMRLGGDHPRN